MKLELLKIKLSEPEKIWMLHLWEKIKKNEKVSYRILRANLYKKLPLNFKPKDIDNRIVGYNGTEITLLGINLIDPEYQIIKKANLVLNAIKELLLEKPETEEFSAKQISGVTKISESDVGMVFKLISPYGRFWNSASVSQDYFGYTSISSPSDNEAFDQYLGFTSIENLINNYYEIKKTEREEDLFYREEYINELPLSKQENIFGSKIEQVDTGLCFVLMPFTEDWSNRVYKKYIRENIESLGLQCLRADNLTGQIIIEDIWIKINQAAFIIADVTGRNPNVMYELGIAHTLGKPVILITQEIDKIPFDFTHLRHYEYEDNVTGQENFSSQLKSVIPQIYIDYYPYYKLNF